MGQPRGNVLRLSVQQSLNTLSRLPAATGCNCPVPLYMLGAPGQTTQHYYDALVLDMKLNPLWNQRQLLHLLFLEEVPLKQQVMKTKPLCLACKISLKSCMSKWWYKVWQNQTKKSMDVERSHTIKENICCLLKFAWGQLLYLTKVFESF